MYVSGYTYKAIGQKLGLKPQQVADILHKHRKNGEEIKRWWKK